jgi:phosphoglucosamine mutase
MINVKLGAGTDWQHHAPFQQACLALERTLGAQGRILIRPSGTEPVLRIMVEAPDMATAQHSATQLAQLLA